MALRSSGVLYAILCSFSLVSIAQTNSQRGPAAQPASIYHEGWIDFNKNGVKELFEDPTQPVERRIAELLSQMTQEISKSP